MTLNKYSPVWSDKRIRDIPGLDLARSSGVPNEGGLGARQLFLTLTFGEGNPSFIFLPVLNEGMHAQAAGRQVTVIVSCSFCDEEQKASRVLPAGAG